MDNIDKKYEIIVTKKRKAIILTSHYLFEKVLDLILIEDSKNKEDSDLENLFQF